MERTHLLIHPFQSSASIHVSFPVCTRNIFSTSRSVYATMIEPCRLFDMFSGSTDCNGVLLLFFNIYLLDIICTIVLHSKLVSTLSKWESRSPPTRRHYCGCYHLEVSYASFSLWRACQKLSLLYIIILVLRHHSLNPLKNVLKSKNMAFLTPRSSLLFLT